MTKTSPTILFFGNERLATGVSTQTPTLRALIEAGYHVAAVVSNYARSRSRNERELEVAQVAAEYGIPVLLPSKPAEIIDQLREFDALAGVLVAYGKIVPQSIIDLFPRGIINIHPSLLPLHRGPTPIESVILSGTTETGVSIMQLVKAMDAGPVYAQARVALSGTETKQELADKLLHKGGELLIENLPAILDGSLEPTPQDDSQATYDQLIDKHDGVVDWSHASATEIERQVRAYAGWPKSRAVLGSTEVVLTGVRPIEALVAPGMVKVDGKQLIVGCVQSALAIERLTPSGKQEMSAAAFLAGYGKNLH